MLLTVAIFSLLSGLAFLLIYSFIIDVRNPVASNMWLSMVAFVVVAFAAILLETGATEISRDVGLVGFTSGGIVIIWRIIIMLKLAKDRKNDDSPPGP